MVAPFATRSVWTAMYGHFEHSNTNEEETMQSDRIQVTIIRWILATGLFGTATGCDDAAPIPRGEIDRHAAQAQLAERVDGQPPLTPAELDDLVIEDPTVRDIAEGRIDGLKISSSFVLGEPSDEAAGECPQREAALSGEPVDEPRDVALDLADELLLDTPVSEACVLLDRSSGDATLVRCERFEAADGGVSLDADFDLMHLDAEAGACWFCSWTFGFVCPSWSQKKMGFVSNGQCVASGFAGCC